MTRLDVWTVWITICGEDEQTRADAYLLGPAVEVECSGVAAPTTPLTDGTVIGADLAAAHALEDLSQRLFYRAAHDEQLDERREHRA